MLNSATATPLRTDERDSAWWSAALRPDEMRPDELRPDELRPDEMAGGTPPWAQYVERSIAAHRCVTPVTAGEDWQQAFMSCLQPLLTVAREDLTAAGHTGVLTEQFLRRLGLRLVKLSSRTLVLELARARDRGELAGATPALRFLDFTHQLVGGSELAEFLAAYPVLARVLGESCRQSIEGHLELLARLAEDRESLVDGIFGGRDPGALVSVEPAGDSHRGGRATATLAFADGRRLIYKPRSLDLHGHFNELVDWLNSKTGLDLRTVRLERRTDYGWLEFITAEPCADEGAVRRFYHRQGALLALLYVLDGTDMHYENLIAVGEHPVLVDIETLFHPSPTPPGAIGSDPASQSIRSSVSRTALLPLLIVGETGSVADVSGLGGDADAPAAVRADWADAGLDSMHLVRRPTAAPTGNNRPILDGIAVEPRDHEIAVLMGFRDAYQAISRNRGELLGPDGMLARCATDQVRFVPRSTSLYAGLLEEATHPNALRAADGRSQLLDLLWEAGPWLHSLVPHELDDLWEGDVPLFTVNPGSRDVWASDGTHIPGVLAAEGLATVERKIASLSDVDQHRQRWLISATLATRPEPIVHHSTASRPWLGTTGAHPDGALAAATDIADEIVAQVIGKTGGAANWIGLELLDDNHWAVRPMGAGLTNGYTGTALFLAQVGALTGERKYCELARDVIRPIPQLLEALGSDQESAQLIGPGLHGLGGISYGLDRLSSLLGDAELSTWLSASLDLAAQLTPDPGEFPAYAEGAAGGLAAMQAIRDVPAAVRLARRYADELVQVVGSGRAAPGQGFARGYQGIAWALGRYGTPGDKYAAAASAAADPDRNGQKPSPGWCSGDAGTTLAQLVAGKPVDLEVYLRTTSERPILADLSLCHGELGAVEPLAWLTESDHPAVEGVRQNRIRLVLAALQQYGPQCGTPRAVPSPGLLTGLAGIGYGLLRLAFPERVPSVLLLESTTGWKRAVRR
ncbi:type 2 lanthipeptide synthetase LanM family protein [Kribbella sp. NBC_01505]|uniref:type 2 lanthipeptide synthetase LanM family protein n=1 Tax=Kribbella sp. NBC_01505 TaxID=2903580 RepID=UPI0038689376